MAVCHSQSAISLPGVTFPAPTSKGLFPIKRSYARLFLRNTSENKTHIRLSLWLPKALPFVGKTELWIVKRWRSNQPTLCNSQTKSSWRHTHWRTLPMGLSSTALFVNKSHVTYSCRNFPLKGCFLNIYKKHVSQNKEKNWKRLPFVSLSVLAGTLLLRAALKECSTPPLSPKEITREPSENCPYSHLKLVRGLLTLGSVDNCFYVSYCKTFFYVNWQLWGFRNKATNPQQDKLLLKFMWNNWKQTNSLLKYINPII